MKFAMSGTRIRDLTLPEFFVGPPAIRVEDEKINETEYGHEGALDDYLVKGPGEWGYPEELARNGPGDAACVAYRARVVARFESELRNAANGEAWTDHRYARRPDFHETISDLLVVMYNFKNKCERGADVLTPGVVFDILYEFMSGEWSQEGAFGFHCQTLLKHGWQRVDWCGTCVRGDLVQGMRDRGLVEDY